jgi:hypothetical protein
MATVVAVVSDLHINSTVALCTPQFTLDDGGTYRSSKQQRWIWSRWRALWETVAERRQGQRLVIVLNGELADDNYHPTTQLISRNPADMMRLSAEVLAPALSLMGENDRLYVLRGTEAHSGPGAWLDEAIAQDIGATGPDDTLASHWRLRFAADGVRFDIAHHPPGGGGRVPWTRGTFANRLAAMTIFDSAENGGKPPHLYVRGHVHRPADSYDLYATRALVLPAWQLQTSYGHRIGGDPLPIGGAIVTCDGGRFEVEKHYWHWPVEGYQAI